MNWQGLSQIETHECFSKETMKAVKSVNEQVAALLNTRTRIDATFKAMEAADDATEIFGNSEMLIAERYEALKQERAIRPLLADALKRTCDDFRKAADAAYCQAETESARVRAGLVAIGFVNTGPTFDSRVAGSIPPGIVYNHPAVVGCRIRTDDLRMHSGRRDHIQANENALAAVESELAAMRARAMATNA